MALVHNLPIPLPCNFLFFVFFFFWARRALKLAFKAELSYEVSHLRGAFIH